MVDDAARTISERSIKRLDSQSRSTPRSHAGKISNESLGKLAMQQARWSF